MRIAGDTSSRSIRTTICKGPSPLVWIVGGDFNCNAGRGVYMPATSTHQSDYVLDGFFADQNGTNFQVTAVTAPQTYGQLITNNLLDPHGFVVNGCHLCWPSSQAKVGDEPKLKLKQCQCKV